MCLEKLPRKYVSKICLIGLEYVSRKFALKIYLENFPRKVVYNISLENLSTNLSRHYILNNLPILHLG